MLNKLLDYLESEQKDQSDAKECKLLAAKYALEDLTKGQGSGTTSDTMLHKRVQKLVDFAEGYQALKKQKDYPLQIANKQCNLYLHSNNTFTIEKD